MRKVQYTYIDIYFNEDEQALADKEFKKLTKQGYEIEQQDSGSREFHFCDQYIKFKLEPIKKQKPDRDNCNHNFHDNGKKYICVDCGISFGAWFTKEKKNKK